MDEEILRKIEEQDKKLEKIYRSVEKMRKYFLWALIITVAVIVLPLIGLMFVMPKFLSIFDSLYLGL
jgi:CHASE3 domain sensor protein